MTAGYEAGKRGLHPLILEKDSEVGGISKTVSHNGYLFDIGGHRVFTSARVVLSYLFAQLRPNRDVENFEPWVTNKFGRKLFDIFFKTYPVYDPGYARRVEIIRDYLSGITNLQTMGRNGLHRYNNQDHSMLSALYAVRNILGEDLNVWDINIDEEYHEIKEESP